jgi:hypothetical protein
VISSKQLYAEARVLYLQQREARGTVKGKTLDNKPCKLPGPYVPTPENQERAATILHWRRRAAELEHGPVRRP